MELTDFTYNKAKGHPGGNSHGSFWRPQDADRNISVIIKVIIDRMSPSCSTSKLPALTTRYQTAGIFTYCYGLSWCSARDRLP